MKLIIIFYFKNTVPKELCVRADAADYHKIISRNNCCSLKKLLLNNRSHMRAKILINATLK